MVTIFLKTKPIYRNFYEPKIHPTFGKCSIKKSYSETLFLCDTESYNEILWFSEIILTKSRYRTTESFTDLKFVGCVVEQNNNLKFQF